MGKQIPQRQCIGCRQMYDKKELIRVVRTPEGQICIDGSGKQNGRGAYLCKKMECLDTALKNHGLERSLKTKVSSELYEELRKEMETIIG